MDSKLCSRCKETKPIDNFPRNRKRKDGRGTYCSSCMAEYGSTYYQRTKERHNPARAQRRRDQRELVLANLVDYLSSHPCVDCGENDVVVLEFDHLGDKVMNVSDMVRKAYAWSSILAEIEKCEVVCANDHRRRTSKTFGWARALGQSDTGAASSRE